MSSARRVKSCSKIRTYVEQERDRAMLEEQEREEERNRAILEEQERETSVLRAAAAANIAPLLV